MQPSRQPRPIEVLFGKLTAIYGAQKMAAMWEGCDIADVQEIWERQLARFSPRSIGGALQRLVDSGTPWPPALPEFVELCRQAAIGRAQDGQPGMLASPGAGVTDINTARANLARVRDLLGGFMAARCVGVARGRIDAAPAVTAEVR